MENKNSVGFSYFTQAKVNPHLILHYDAKERKYCFDTNCINGTSNALIFIVYSVKCESNVVKRSLLKYHPDFLVYVYAWTNREETTRNVCQKLGNYY